MSAIVALSVLVSSFWLTFLMIPPIISFSFKKGLLDAPGASELKAHKAPVPYLGGIGIFLGFFIPAAFIRFVLRGPGELSVIFICSLSLSVLGALDDHKNIRPKIRLLGQLAIACATVLFLIKAGKHFPFGYPGILMMIFFIIATINSVNLLDGLDGLAGGAMSISLAGFSIIFFLKGDPAFMLLALALLGATCGFLPYNFNPAKVFMGDNGSIFLGYLISVFAIRASSGSPVLFFITLALIGLPVVDTSTAVIRRFLKRKPLMKGDRDHLYDRLMGTGLSVKKTVLICYGIQIFLVSCSLLGLRGLRLI